MPATTRLATQKAIAAHDPLTVRALPPHVGDSGHHALSEYVELYYLPLAGPSATLALRRLAAGGGAGVHGQIVKTLTRLVELGFATMDDDAYRVRLFLPSLSPRQLARLPKHLKIAHAVLDEYDRVPAGWVS